MRRPLFVAVIATLLLPSVLAAQPQDADSKEAAHVADAQATPAATPGNHASSRSLMGMVMGAMIQSAEQQSKSNPAAGQRDSPKQDPGKTKPADARKDPAARTKPVAEQVAVQSEP
ncbi:hypothetical protein GCM10027431_15780 [Lysobacter rhizosphaerae]